MIDGEVRMTWEYWPEPQIGEPRYDNDPIQKTCTAVSLRHAVHIAEDIKKEHGKNLRFVDVTMRLVE